MDWRSMKSDSLQDLLQHNTCLIKNHAPRKPTTKPPRFYREFVKKYRVVGETYEARGDAVEQQGPLNDRERALVKLAISGSNRYQSACTPHVRRAAPARVSRQ